MKETIKIIKQGKDIQEHLKRCSHETGLSPEDLEDHATLWFYFKHSYQSGVDFGDPLDRCLNFTLNPKCHHRSNFDTHETWFSMPYGEIKRWFPEEIDELIGFHQVEPDEKFIPRSTKIMVTTKNKAFEIMKGIDTTKASVNVFEISKDHPQFIGLTKEEEDSIRRSWNGNPDLLPGCVATGLIITEIEEENARN